MAKRTPPARLTQRERLEDTADREQVKQEQQTPEPVPVPGPFVDPVLVSQHALVWQLERRARIGHSTNADRELMQDAARELRVLLGLDADSPLLYPQPSSYAPVQNDPPIGHSLPGGPSKRP